MKKLFLMVGILSLITLSSCVNHQTNNFIEGTYFSGDRENRLEISKITEEEFASAEKINVVKDHSINKNSDYFSVKFYKIIENKWVNMPFHNLSYSATTNTQPCEYSCDEGSLSFDTNQNFWLYYNENSYTFNKSIPQYSLTFKYVDDNVDELRETIDTSTFTYQFEYQYNYQLTDEDINTIFATITKDLPMSGGGYWTIGGYYSSLDKDEFILENNVVNYDYTIYYTWIGGPAEQPTI